MAITVTATQGGVTGAGTYIRVKNLGNAVLAGSPATGNSGTSPQAAITTTVTGSVVYAAILGGTNTSLTAAPGTATLYDNIADAVNNWRYGSSHTAVTGTPGAVTVGSSTPAPGNCALLEILSSGGSITELDSGTIFNSTTGATTITSPSFTPVPGTLLVAIVSSGGSGAVTMAVSDTSGLIWTQQSSNGSGAYAGVWTALVPPAPATRPAAARRAPPRRAVSGGVRGKTNLPLAPPPPTSSVRFPTPKHPRGLWRRVTGKANLPLAPPPPTSSVRIPVPKHPRGVWRRVAGSAPPPPVPAVPPRLAPEARRPGPARGLWRRVTGTSNLPPVVTAIPRLPLPPRRFPPARGLWRRVTGTANLAPVVTSRPQPPPQPRRLRPGRGLWRQVTGSVPPPPVVVFDHLPPPPTFPLTPLDVRTELLLAGTWTDITSFVVQGTGPISATRGHPDESTTTTPSGTQLTLNNRDARFTAGNPTGPYYGQLVRNTQLRTSVPEGVSYLRSEGDQASYAECPDTAGISITGDTELQLDLTLDNWNGSQLLAAKWAPGQASWLLLLWNDGTLQFQWSQDGTSINSARTSVSIVPPPLRRMSLRVTLAVATGSVTYYTGPPGLSSPSWTQLGPAIVLGANSVFDSTATLQLGYGPSSGTGFPGIYGKIHAAQLLSGIGGTAKASPDFTAQSPGTTSFSDAQGNAWTLHGTAGISNRKYRLHAETSAWPQSWDPSGTDVTVALTAAGVLRRMSQGTAKPLNSAMNRAYVRLGGSIAPVAYWPCEDGTQATQLASGLGGAAMQIAGAPSLASDSSFLCSLPIPVLSNSSWAGTVPPYAGGTDNVMRFLMHVPAGGDVNGAVIARMFTTGPVARVDLVYSTGGGLTLNLYNGAGTLLATSGGVAFGVNGQLLRASVELQASGADIKFNMATLAVGAGGASVTTNTLVSTAIGQVTQAVINPGGLLASTAVGQISVQPVWDTLFDLAGALQAWVGEAAGVRFKRLLAEEGIAFRGQGNLADTVAMGPQAASALTTLLQECADADRGDMVEPRQALALGYRTRASKLNQAPAVTLPYSMLMFPLGETEDDQIVQNDVTAQNADGSSSNQVQASGPLSVQAPPNGVGRYDVSVPVNIAADSALDSEAAWILHMGTVAEPRYPQIDIDLATAEAAIVSRYYDLLDLDLGDRLVITSPPPWLPPGQIDQLVQGVTENVGVKILNMAWAGVPSSPWNVLVWNDLVWGRWTTAGATLHAGISSGATSMLVDSPNSLWTTSGGDFPFDLIVAGERITVTNITGASSPQTFTIVRAVNGVTKAQTAGTAVDLFYPPIWSL